LGRNTHYAAAAPHDLMMMMMMMPHCITFNEEVKEKINKLGDLFITAFAEFKFQTFTITVKLKKKVKFALNSFTLNYIVQGY
jgi:hypothetical protein